MELLSQVIVTVLSIWTVLSIVYWILVIFALLTNDSADLQMLRVDNMLQLILAILFPFLYLVYVVICMGIVLVKNSRNIFKK
jgi:hypothetical protein